MKDGQSHTTASKAFALSARPPRQRPKLTPVSVRFTAEEKAKLKRDATGQPLSAYIRDCALTAGANGNGSIGGRNQKPELARVLAALGRSNLARNFEQLSYAVHEGSVQLSVESEAALCQACADIAAMRRDLLRALGLRPD